MFIIHARIVLTGDPAQNCCYFTYFRVSQKKNIKRNETFGNVIFGMNMIQRTWTLRQESHQEATRKGGAPIVGPTLLHRRTHSSYIYLCTPKWSEASTKTLFRRSNLLYPWYPILGPFPAPCRRGIQSRRASTSTLLPFRWSVSSYHRPTGP